MDYGLTERLSPRFIYAQRSHFRTFGFDGMTHWEVFSLLKHEGIPLERDYPTTGGSTNGKYDTPASIPADVKRKAKMHRVSQVVSFIPTFHSVDSAKNRLKQLLNQYSAGIMWSLIWRKADRNNCAIYSGIQLLERHGLSKLREFRVIYRKNLLESW